MLFATFSMLSHAVSHVEQTTVHAVRLTVTSRTGGVSAVPVCWDLNSVGYFQLSHWNGNTISFPIDQIALITLSATRQSSYCVLEKPERVQHSSLVRSGVTGPPPTLQAAPPKVRARPSCGGHSEYLDPDSTAKPHWRESSLRRNFLQGVGHMRVRTLIGASAVTLGRVSTV